MDNVRYTIYKALITIKLKFFYKGQNSIRETEAERDRQRRVRVKDRIYILQYMSS